MPLLQLTQDICKQYGIKPARSKGQNFLINEDVYDTVVAAADIKPSELVLEVGPGLGFLTAKLAQKAKKVVAVELDNKLAHYLKTALKSKKIDNVTVLNGNVLDLEVNDGSYKIVANLPYNISSVFLRKFLSMVKNKPELLVLLLQKEVAERIAAKPGKMSLLALSVQFYAEAAIVRYVPPTDFWPAPEVDSAVIRIVLRDYGLWIKDEKGEIDEKKFFQLAKFGFIAKRKMLKNNLAAGFKVKTTEIEEKLTQVGLQKNIRAEDLSMNDWINLYKLFF